MNTSRSTSLLPTRAAAGADTLAPSQSRAPVDQHLRTWMHEGLHDLPPQSTVLAIGCDEAFLAPQLAQYAATVTVLDTSAGQMAQLARRFPDISFLRHNPSHPLPFQAETFDAIWCCEFLDRVFDPATALREMHRVLAPGGRLMVTVPDHGSLGQVWHSLFQSDGPLTLARPRIRQFTRGMLVTLARQSEFEDIHTATGGPALRQAPRSLILRARKGPVMAQVPAGRRRATSLAPDPGTPDLLTTGRLRAA